MLARDWLDDLEKLKMLNIGYNFKWAFQSIQDFNTNKVMKDSMKNFVSFLITSQSRNKSKACFT